MRRAALGALLLALSVNLGSCVPAPSDPLGYGELCAPDEGDCTNSVLLVRDVTGRNQVDWIVTNEGDTTTTVEVLALVPGATDDAGLDDVDPDELIARREYTGLSAGEEVDDRFTAQDLGVRDSFLFVLNCTGCEARLEWVFSTVPRECFEDDECVANWQCDQNLGRCVECLQNSDCNEDQICDIARGRCDPPETTAGCATAPGEPVSLLVGVLFLLVVLRSRRRGLAATALVAVLVLGGGEANASPPRASISIGTGPRFLAGSLGAETRRGVGFGIGQELRWRYIGAGIGLSTSYFLTSQQGPPFSRQFQTYSVTLGPRVYLPIRWFEVAAGADYRRLGLTNNSLVRLTGTRVSFDAVGGNAGFRLRWSGLEVRLEGGVHQVIQIPSTLISVDLSLGFTNPN